MSASLTAPDHTLGAAKGFQVAALPARAMRCVRPAINDDVTALGTVAVLAPQDHVIHDDTAADAGAEREHHHAAQGASTADPEFAIGGGVGVILEADRQAGVRGQAIANGKIGPARQVRRVQQHSGRNIHGAGGAKADARDLILTDARPFRAPPARRPPCGARRPRAPFSALVSMLSHDSGRPRSSTTPTLMLVPPRSTPTKNGG